MLDLLIPGLMIVTACAALAKRQDVYGALLEGGLDGLKLLVTIVPALVVLLTAVHMLRASGAIELLTNGSRPWPQPWAFPPRRSRSCCCGRSLAAQLWLLARI